MAKQNNYLPEITIDTLLDFNVTINEISKTLNKQLSLEVRKNYQIMLRDVIKNFDSISDIIIKFSENN